METVSNPATLPVVVPPVLPIGVVALKAIAEAFDLTPEMLATDAGAFIGAILRPIVKEEIAALKEDILGAIRDSYQRGNQNEDFQKTFTEPIPFGDRAL